MYVCARTRVCVRALHVVHANIMQSYVGMLVYGYTDVLAGTKRRVVLMYWQVGLASALCTG